MLVLCIAGAGARGEPPEFSPGALGLKVPVVTYDELDRHIGRVVAVRGVAERRKVVRLSGVEVRCPDELRGREAYAVGILAKWVITEAPKGVPNDGPGVKYVLYFDLSGRLAEARPIPE